MSGSNITGTRRALGNGGASSQPTNGRAARPSLPSSGPSASWTRRATSSNSSTMAGITNSNGQGGGGGGKASLSDRESTLQIPLAIPASTLLRLGVSIDPASSSSSATTVNANANASTSGDSNHNYSVEELEAIREDLQRAKEAADVRSREVSRRRERIIASSSSTSRYALPSASSSQLRSKLLSPTVSTSSKPTSSNNKSSIPLNASTLVTNNAINNVPSRGVKRGRAPDSASDSSLSPQSVTSISSFEPSTSQNAGRPPSSRHTSPAVSTSTVGSSASVGLGLSSAKLSRTTSTSKDKEGSVPPPGNTLTAANTSLSSSTGSTTKDGGVKTLAIPGMGAPMPALPGFTKKKKQEKQASPAPSSSSRHMSPPTEQAPPRASTSTLPPPPSSLPPRPASLPPKPVNSYGAAPQMTASSSSSSTHRRDTSATGSTTSSRDRDRDRDREREKEKDRLQREKEKSVKHDKDGGRERSISKGKESDRGLTTEHHDSESKSLSSVDISRSKTAASKREDRGAEGVDALVQPPEPTTRPPEVDEPPPPPPLPQYEEQQEGNEDMSGTAAELLAPMIAVEDATPTPEPETTSRAKEADLKHISTASRAVTPSAELGPRGAPASTEKPVSQTGLGRKTLPPPTATAKSRSATPESASASAPKAAQAIIPASAVPANLAAAPPSRPGTPLGRKKLPDSVTAAASRRESPAPARDGTPLSSTAGHPAGMEARSSLTGSSAVSPIGPPGQSQEGGKTSSANAEALAALEAKQKRKEEKRKRKLAALTNGSVTPQGSPKPNGHVLLNGSPAIKINGVSPSSLRNDAHPPSKMRRVDSATSIDSNDKGGLKVKLNGVTLNRTKSSSPGDIIQAPVKKGPTMPGVADDFSLPTRSLVPPAPVIHLPAPTPSKQSEINENFDNAKPSTQVPYTTFANWVNDFFRSFGEDDLAFLAPKPEDPGVYDIPPLGPHYQDTWAVMDAELAGEQADPPPPSNALVPPALKRFKSQNLTTAALPTETTYLGPLGERLISAFKDTKDLRGIMDDLFAAQSEMQSNKDNAESGMAVDPAQAPVAGQPHGSSAAQGEAGFNMQTSPQIPAPAMFNDPNVLSSMPSIKDMDALDFESRLTRELSFLGIIPLPARIAPPPPVKPSKKAAAAEPSTAQVDISSSVDWSSRADDEIATALRACQRQLKKQVALNDKRKERLSTIVRQRIAYQEYEHLRDGLEAVIEAAWAKRQRAAQRKAQKDRKEKDKKGDKEKDRDKLEAASLAQSIAALNTPQPLSASLVAALTKRRNLVDSVQPLFPPNAYILPTESIFQGLDEGVHQEM